LAANHLVQQIFEKNQIRDFDLSFKQTLLLINNSISCIPSGHGWISHPDSLGEWHSLIWQKLAMVASEKLKEFMIPFNYIGCKFSIIDIALPYLAKFRNLQILELNGTAFNDTHLVQLCQKVPSLRRLAFTLIPGEVTDVSVQALSQLEKLQDLLYKPVHDEDNLEEFDEKTDLLTEK